MQTNWIDNRAAISGNSEEIAVVNPATEETIDTISKGSAADIDQAVAAARSAHPAWAALAPVERGKALKQAAALMRENRDDIGRALTIENGKPLFEATREVMGAVNVTLSFAELVVHMRAGHESAAAGDLVFQHRQARGVAGCIVPWNYPISVAIENVAANLAVGNTVVWKPSEKTPLASRMLIERVFAHLPAGVLNMVLGDGPGAGEPLVKHAGVDVVVFVGSERTGRRIGELCGGAIKKCILELGGKDPLIVDETVDIGAAARLAAEATYINAGQICTSTERLYVQRRVFDDFLGALVEESAKFQPGDGLDADTRMGPLVDHLQLEKVIAHVDDAVGRGAEVVCGGARLNRKGYFYPPTVLTGITDEMRLMEEETFGPVAPLIPFDEFDEAIHLANDCRYGLAAIVCTTSAPRAIKAIEELKAGMVKINTGRGKAPGATSEPFGASGLGHGYGIELLHELTREKSVHWRADFG